MSLWKRRKKVRAANRRWKPSVNNDLGVSWRHLPSVTNHSHLDQHVAFNGKGDYSQSWIDLKLGKKTWITPKDESLLYDVFCFDLSLILLIIHLCISEYTHHVCLPSDLNGCLFPISHRQSLHPCRIEDSPKIVVWNIVSLKPNDKTIACIKPQQVQGECISHLKFIAFHPCQSCRCGFKAVKSNAKSFCTMVLMKGSFVVKGQLCTKLNTSV